MSFDSLTISKSLNLNCREALSKSFYQIKYQTKYFLKQLFTKRIYIFYLPMTYFFSPFIGNLCQNLFEKYITRFRLIPMYSVHNFLSSSGRTLNWFSKYTLYNIFFPWHFMQTWYFVRYLISTLYNIKWIFLHSTVARAKLADKNQKPIKLKQLKKV